MKEKLKFIYATGVTLAAFSIYALCFYRYELPYGLRSVWPAFIFIFAFSLYLASKPFREENDA